LFQTKIEGKSTFLTYPLQKFQISLIKVLKILNQLYTLLLNFVECY